MTINIATKTGVHLDRWSLGNGVPMPTLMPDNVEDVNYFVYYAYAMKPAKPCQFWFEVEVMFQSSTICPATSYVETL